MEKNYVKNIKFLYTRTNSNHIFQFNDNVNNFINVNFNYLSNETNPRFVAITFLEKHS